jgi:hypothetical protein
MSVDVTVRFVKMMFCARRRVPGKRRKTQIGSRRRGHRVLAATPFTVQPRFYHSISCRISQSSDSE